MRLTRADFSKVGAKRREIGRFFTLTASPVQDGTKFACIVSKKTTPKAHDRNLIRRRARAAFRELAPKKTALYIFAAKKNVNAAAYNEIRADIASLILKAGLA